MPVEQVWLIRHGLTDWNREKRWQGHAPTTLNEEGHQQAERLATHLKGTSIQAIYSSDTPRAYQTAEALARAYGLPIHTDERLREFKLGVFEGLTSDEVSARHPEEFSQWRTGDFDFAPTNGESRRQLQERAVAAFKDITEREEAENVAIVTHGGTLRLMLQRLCNTDPRTEGLLAIPNTSYTTLRRNGADWDLTALTVTPHLDGSANTNHP